MNKKIQQLLCNLGIHKNVVVQELLMTQICYCQSCKRKWSDEAGL